MDLVYLGWYNYKDSKAERSPSSLDASHSPFNACYPPRPRCHQTSHGGPASKENMTLLVYWYVLHPVGFNIWCPIWWMTNHEKHLQVSKPNFHQVPDKVQEARLSILRHPQIVNVNQHPSVVEPSKVTGVNCDQHPWHWVPNCGFNHHSSRGTKDRIELMTLMPQTCLGGCPSHERRLVKNVTWWFRKNP